MEERLKPLLGPIVREAGKTFGNAVGEVREAVDFLRYYAGCVEGFSNETHRALGVVACISPWNFPLSIFTGTNLALSQYGQVARGSFRPSTASLMPLFA